MHRFNRRHFLSITPLALAPLGLKGEGGPLNESQSQPSNAPGASGAQALHELFRTEWDYAMEHDPAWASSLGDRRWNDRWPDLSLAALERDHAHEIGTLDRLKVIDRNELSPRDQLNYDLFKEQRELGLEGFPFHWHLVPLNQRGGIQTLDEVADGLRFTTVRDFEDWIARLRSFPAYMEQTMALMQQGIKERMLLPKIVMQRIPAQIDKQIVADPAASPFYRPFQRNASAVSEGERRRLAAAAATAIKADVVPAFQRFKDFFVGKYLPACFDQVGIWQVPRGEELYAYFVRAYTTTDMTPHEIHQVGLDEVKRIHDEMLAVMKETGYQGTLQEFFKFLRTDPQFFYQSPDELLEAYRALAKQVDPQLVKVFRLLPRLPYGVEPIPAGAAPDTTTAYYFPGAPDAPRAGTYYVNLYKPETRPKWEMTALTLHESVPGHHLQMSLALEQTDLPSFRRHAYYDAFGEGWGLYAESLGYEMGLYGDAYAKFGQLTYDMWRAVRLVVDTGIHAMHWDRQRALDYLLENAAKEELDITNEIDRYIAWPGQALAYKIGQLRIKELRDRAARRLGGKFDLREFHEAVLINGALPLNILQRNVEEWIRMKA